MTRITFDGFRMEAQGHAGYAPIGHDLVCAAISILMTTTAEMILRMKKQGYLETEPELRLAPGNVLLDMKPKPWYEDTAEIIMDFARAGCELLQESYPEYVCIYSAKG